MQTLFKENSIQGFSFLIDIIYVKYNWRYIHNRPGPYPELYLYQDESVGWIKVEVNRLQKVVKLQVDGNESYYSVIKRRHILREKNLQTGSDEKLDEKIRPLGITISSLPDNEVLEIIGGNYGILTEFLGQAKRIVNHDYALIRKLWKKQLYRVKSIFHKIRNAILAVLEMPKWQDLLDTALISTGAWAVFQINYDLLAAASFALTTSIASGFIDMFARKKEPYLLKIFIVFMPGVYLVYLGFLYQ